MHTYRITYISKYINRLIDTQSQSQVTKSEPQMVLTLYEKVWTLNIYTPT